MRAERVLLLFFRSASHLSPRCTRACNVPDPFNDTVRFDTDSDNYCPQLLDELATSAQLTPYQDPPMAVPQVGGLACAPEGRA